MKDGNTIVRGIYMDLCAVVLCGGQSSRMGTNKSLLQISNYRVVEKIVSELKKLTNHVVLIANDEKPYEYLKVPIYKDRYNDAGPLAGIESAMYHVDAERFIFAACDMPFVNKHLYEYLLTYAGDYEAIVPKYNGQVHPLASIYSRNCLPVIKEKLDAGDYRVSIFFHEIEHKFVTLFPNIDEEVVKYHFFNMNTPVEYEEAKKIAEELLK